MIRSFFNDVRGNYMVLTAVAIVPIMGALALAIDYGNMSRQRQETLNALDAAGVATGRYIASGATDDEATQYARDFFEANLGAVNPVDASLVVILPKNNTGGATLKLTANMKYHPYFFPTFAKLIGEASGDTNLSFNASSEVRLKNTLEVALALDNSGSMDYLGSGSGKKRIDLLKDSAKQLIDTLAKQGEQMKQLPKPVQFSLVPFAASVNIGPENANATWMDTTGISPVHHENFDWSTLNSANKKAEKVDGVWYKKGSDWGDAEGQVLTRFSLYQDMTMVSDREWVSTGREYVCYKTRRNGTCKDGGWENTGYYDETVSSYASWQGCVEERPYPYNVDDTTPSSSNGETLFVPMFAPDEAGDRWDDGGSYDNYSAPNNWWNDGTETNSTSTRQKNMAKYFTVRPYGASTSQGTGPNYSCTTNEITPLTDVTVQAGKDAIKASIDAMQPNGGTNVPEGVAWGWRTVSSGAPFTEGRSDSENGNDKVVIVLTDGENTYYTPGSLGYSNTASNKSIYSSYGYTGKDYDDDSTTRLFMGTSNDVNKNDYSNSNYTKALNEQFAKLCDNMKDNAGGTRQDKIIIMTVSLDLDKHNNDEKDQIAALKACASGSRFRKDPDDPSKPAKLYWNATGASLADDFKEIADELSNLRIVG